MYEMFLIYFLHKLQNLKNIFLWNVLWKVPHSFSPTLQVQLQQHILHKHEHEQVSISPNSTYFTDWVCLEIECSSFWHHDGHQVCWLMLQGSIGIYLGNLRNWVVWPVSLSVFQCRETPADKLVSCLCHQMNRYLIFHCIIFVQISVMSIILLKYKYSRWKI